MMRALHREAFYATGSWSEASCGVYVGWTALEGGLSDGMPLRNQDGNVVLAFSGEEFPASGRSGTSYVVRQYEEDKEFPRGLNGRFHGVLCDRKLKRVMLFNDRYGMHRLYYHESKDTFYFASEAKALIAVRPELGRICPEGLREYIGWGSVLDNRSLFAGIGVLPPGSKWEFHDGKTARKGTYFSSTEWEGQEKLDLESYYSELRRVFTENLPRYFTGDQRIAMSLTGGLDTRMIMAWQRPPAGSLPCYTFGGMRRDCQDVIVGRKVAEACHQPYTVIPLGKDFLTRFSDYAERAVYATDGCADVGRAPDLYLNAKAREFGPVRMTGNYGGEVLRKVRGFKPGEPFPGLFCPDVVAPKSQIEETYAGMLKEHPVSFAVFKQGPWHHYGVLALEQTQLSLRTPYLDNDFVQTVFRAPEAALATRDISLRLIGDGNKRLLQIPTDRGVVGTGGDVSSALSHGLLEFLFKAEYGYDMGMPQWVARVDHLLSGFHFDRLFLGRHKIFHFRTWYRDALSGYVQEMLLDARSLARPYIDRKKVQAVVTGHLNGTRNYTNELHKLLTLEIIHRLFVDSAGASDVAGSTTAVATPVLGET
jgi:asparagine synthase (glutamine-hydrolysing)